MTKNPCIFIMLVICERPVSFPLSFMRVFHSHTFRNSECMDRKNYNKRKKPLLNMPDNITGISCNIKSLVINETKSIKPRTSFSMSIFSLMPAAGDRLLPASHLSP